MVNAVRKFKETTAVSTELAFKRLQTKAAEVSDCYDAQFLQSGFRDFTHTRDTAHRERQARRASPWLLPALVLVVDAIEVVVVATDVVVVSSGVVEVVVERASSPPQAPSARSDTTSVAKVNRDFTSFLP